jgi:hypothetical protein
MAVLALVAGGIVLTASSADAKIRSNEAWCLETSLGRDGGSMFECRYSSRSQCMQSKVNNADRCMRNPRRR